MLIQQYLTDLVYKWISIIIYCRTENIAQGKVSSTMNHAVFLKPYNASYGSKKSHKTGAMGTSGKWQWHCDLEISFRRIVITWNDSWGYSPVTLNTEINPKCSCNDGSLQWTISLHFCLQLSLKVTLNKKLSGELASFLHPDSSQLSHQLKSWSIFISTLVFCFSSVFL